MNSKLFKHQEAAFKSLLETSGTFFDTEWRSFPIKPRFSRFIVGPSGCGKTHIARVLAEHLDAPFYSVDATSWIPLGANERSARPTWTDLCDFIEKNDKGIIFLDELDKLGRPNNFGGSSWLQHVRLEVFAVLDGRIPPNITFASCDDEGERGNLIERLNARLKNGMMVIGAGAFQDEWENRSKPVIGLVAAKDEQANDFSHKNMQSCLPAELTNRFAAPIVVIEPLKFDDYKELLYRTAYSLPKGLAVHLTRIGKQELPSAVEGGLGVRWIEGILLKALAQRKLAAKQPRPELSLAAQAA